MMDIKRIEEELMDRCDLVKKSDRVYYAKNHPSKLCIRDLLQLKEIARHHGVPVCRICMHTDDQDPIHEMLMIHLHPQKVGPLKQNKTSLSYHLLDGYGTVRLFNDAGEEQEVIKLGSGIDDIRHLRLDANVFREIESLSDYMIFLEVASGPFADEDTIWL